MLSPGLSQNIPSCCPWCYVFYRHSTVSYHHSGNNKTDIQEDEERKKLQEQTL